MGQFSALQISDGELVRMSVDALPTTNSINVVIDGKPFEIRLVEKPKPDMRDEVPEEVKGERKNDVLYNGFVDQDIAQIMENIGPTFEQLPREERREKVMSVKVSILKTHGVPEEDAIAFVKRMEEQNPKFDPAQYRKFNSDLVDLFQGKIDEYEMDDQEGFDQFYLAVSKEEERLLWYDQKVIDDEEDSGISEENLKIVTAVLVLWKQLYAEVRLQTIQTEISYEQIRKLLEKLHLVITAVKNQKPQQILV